MAGHEPLKNWKHEQFACQVASGIPATAAYKNVGYGGKAAASNASTLLKNQNVAERVAFLRQGYAEAQAEAVKVDREWLTKQYLTLATADPNELIRVKTGACRHCHGTGGAYQWRDEAEFEAAYARWANLPERKQAAQPMPNNAGGYGYTLNLPINPDCPKCDGVGTSRIAVADTSKASPAARRLLATVKETKDGVEIKVHDQMHALDQLGRIIGAFEKDNEQQNRPSDALVAAIMAVTRGAGSKIPFAPSAPSQKEDET